MLGWPISTWFFFVFSIAGWGLAILFEFKLARVESELARLAHSASVVKLRELASQWFARGDSEVPEHLGVEAQAHELGERVAYLRCSRELRRHLDRNGGGNGEGR